MTAVPLVNWFCTSTVPGTGLWGIGVSAERKWSVRGLQGCEVRCTSRWGRGGQWSSRLLDLMRPGDGSRRALTAAHS